MSTEPTRNSHNNITPVTTPSSSSSTIRTFVTNLERTTQAKLDHIVKNEEIMSAKDNQLLEAIKGLNTAPMLNSITKQITAYQNLLHRAHETLTNDLAKLLQMVTELAANTKTQFDRIEARLDALEKKHTDTMTPTTNDASTAEN